MISAGTSNYIIEEVAGCGRFQVVFVLVMHYLGRMAVVFSTIFMAFGIYNPGWRCLDQVVVNGSVTYSGTNMSLTGNRSSGKNNEIAHYGNVTSFSNDEFIKDNCPVFEACSNIEYESSASTLVSEWGLLCDKAWLGPMIMSVQMIGLLIGSFVSGALADSLGRKPVFYGFQMALALLNGMCIFSVSWKMFAVFRFFIGIACGGGMSITYVLLSEFMTVKWRAAFAAIPAWSTDAIVCGICVMLIKDWVMIHIAVVVIALAGFIPLIWVPESIRWLEVKNKTKKFTKVAKKMTKMNKKCLPPMEDLMTVVSPTEGDAEPGKENKVLYSFVDLFRPGYRLYTIIVCYQYFSLTMGYYGISFGVESLSGDFYINSIVLYAADIPFQFFPLFAPNLLGRKLTCFVFIGFAVLSFFTASGFAASSMVGLETTGVRVLIMLAKAGFMTAWCVLYTQITEIYPTVVRANAKSLANGVSRIGGIIAPFLIPRNPDTKYIIYSFMGFVALLHFISVFFLPETRGKYLKETFNDREDRDDQEPETTA